MTFRKMMQSSLLLVIGVVASVVLLVVNFAQAIGDGSSDLDALMSCFGQSAGSECVKADFNSDSVVNLSDFSLLRASLRFDLTGDNKVTFQDEESGDVGEEEPADTQTSGGGGSSSGSQSGGDAGDVTQSDDGSEDEVPTEPEPAPTTDLGILKSCLGQLAEGDCVKADFNIDGVLNTFDLGLFKASIVYDLNGDGKLTYDEEGDSDFTAFQSCFGQTIEGDCAEADLNGDSVINLSDFSLFRSSLKFDLNGDLVVDYE